MVYDHSMVVVFIHKLHHGGIHAITDYVNTVGFLLSLMGLYNTQKQASLLL